MGSVPKPGTFMVNKTCQYARRAGVVAAAVGQVPNQPIVFKVDNPLREVLTVENVQFYFAIYKYRLLYHVYVRVIMIILFKAE